MSATLPSGANPLSPFAVADAAARTAGALLLDAFASPASPLLGHRQTAASKSSDIDLVTEFDRRAEEVIVSRLRAAFPDDEIIAEEGGLRAPSLPGSGAGANRPRSRWLVDPLDGTTNFAHGVPFYCVSIARETDGRVELGVVHAPALGLHFTATRGGGAFANGTPLHVSDTAILGRSMLATGFPYDRHTSADNNFAQFIAFQKRVQAVRRFGSAALDLCLVAAGNFDGYWEMKLRPWDSAAGSLLVEEAGGRITDWRGAPYLQDRGALVASNALLHDQILLVLEETGIPAAAA